MDQPYMVDIDGYIMYLDQAPHMWHEIEGREDLVANEVTSTCKTNLKQGPMANVIDEKGSLHGEERSSMVRGLGK